MMEVERFDFGHGMFARQVCKYFEERLQEEFEIDYNTTTIQSHIDFWKSKISEAKLEFKNRIISDLQTEEPYYAVIFYMFRWGLIWEAINYASNKSEDIRKIGLFLKNYEDGKIDIKQVKDFMNSNPV